MRLIYLDESSDDQLWVYSALVLTENDWREAFELFRAYRRALKRDFGVFVHKELHATDLVGGRGRISDRIVTKYERSLIFLKTLETIASLPGIRIFNSCFPKHDHMLAFERLMNRMQRALENWGDNGLLICDEGKEAQYIRLVRKMKVFNPIPSQYGRWQDTGEPSKNIPINRIIEDPFFKKSDRSYFVQCADNVAFSLLRRERPLASRSKYNIHKGFDLLDDVLIKEATRRDPQGILRP